MSTSPHARGGSVAGAAAEAARLLDSGERLSHIWRFTVLQLLDVDRSTLRHHGFEPAVRIWSEAPPSTGDARVDAAFAALAEHLARRNGWAVPAWAMEPLRQAEPWWFVTDLVGRHPRALVESPPSFRKLGIFITSDALSRA